MYIESEQIIYSPSDLTLYMDSPFASWMEHLAITSSELLSSPDEEDQLMAVLQHKGIQHENEILDSFHEKKLNIAQISKGPNAEEDTFSAMQSGADIIYQAALSLNPFKGYADFLVKVPGKCNLGDFYYEVWDTKLAKTIKPYFVIQLCCYADMLEALQGRRPDHIVVILGNDEQVRLNTTDYFYYYRNLKHQFLQTHQAFSPQNRPDPANSNSWGRWSTYAEELLKEADHLSQVATITKSQIKKLNKAGIHTMLSLIETDLDRVKGMNNDVFTRLKAQARIQNASVGKDVPLYQILPHDPQKKMGLSLLPPTSSLDIYFDIEGFPLEDGGLEYLWGLVYFDENGKRQYRDFWAHTEEQEKQSFKAFIEWTYARWLRDPTMHIYHYANYEIAACRKLMGRYGICEYEVDQLLRNEVFVDLYKVVKGCLLLGEPRYSIKNVEHLYRGKRSTEVGSGGDSVVVYERWREDPDGESWETSKILNAIREYNIDDCNSTQELVDWLRLRQQEQKISYLGKTEIIEPEVKEEITALIQLRDKLLQKATLLLDHGQEKNSRVTSLLAWSLEFHRREKKPMYWRLFDRMGLSSEELVDDIDCLANCVRTDKQPYKPTPKARNLVHEYMFDPNQEFKATNEKYFVLGEERAGGKNLSVTLIKEDSRLGDGYIALQTSEPLNEVITLIPDENISAKPIPEAITAQVQAFDQGRLGGTAIFDFLMRSQPRIIDHQPGKPITTSNDPDLRLLEIIHAIRHLDNSYLAIQGPPGSGKSFTAKHVIAELLKLGKKIGISSNSHKAINHLLIHTAKYCKEQGIKAYFACTKNTDEDALGALDIDVYKNESIADHLQPSCVIGTTAWGFARNDLENAFDYLFIDEAGQVSVANLIAMSRSTKNIVLMGDQMQLGQPSQGSHPEDSGLSILDYLLHETPTIPDTMGVFLGTTYRMHSTVNKFISDAIYEGKLESAPDNDRQAIQVPEGYQGILNKEAGIITVPVFHEGNTQASDEEVEQIALLANQLIGRVFTAQDGVERLISWDDILFVAPYNHQVNKLRQALGNQAKIGSVDKFQGQEAPIVFLSMCASNANESARGMNFLFDKNRINVAVSRAQCMAVVVYSPTLLNTKVSNVVQMGMVNLFCKFAGMRFDFFCIKVDKKINEIQDEFKNTSKLTSKLQQKINLLDNLTAYRMHSSDSEIKSEINTLLTEARPYSDVSQVSAISSFPGNYLNKIFELAMFKFLTKTQKFSLCTRTTVNISQPDYLFICNSKEHQLECITRTSSLMDQVFSILPYINQFISALEIMNKKHIEYINQYHSDPGHPLWNTSIDIFFRDLSLYEQKTINNLMQEDYIDVAQKKLQDWVYLIRYAGLFFKDIISDSILKKLEDIGFPKGLCGHELHDKNTMDLTIKGIAKAVIDKSEKLYFNSSTPITLAISFSLGRNFLSVPHPEILISLVHNLGRAITEQKKSSSIKGRLNNLYAIIIDTSWYNWFPEIAIKRHNAQFPKSFNNCYGCIYNETHPLVKAGTLLYDKIPFIGYLGNGFKENYSPD